MICLVVPFSKSNEYVKAYKQAKRKDDDIAIANACLRVELEEKDGVVIVTDATFAFGGMAPTSVIAKNSSEFVIGKEWNISLVDEVSRLLIEDMPMSYSTPGGQVEYRKTLALSFFTKFFLNVNHEISSSIKSFALDERELSVLEDISREISKGQQINQEAEKGAIVGESVMHLSALKQVTGEALYIDDIPKQAIEYYACFVPSTEAHAKIM
ncbi:hypothetical protein HK096_000180 [Nowakowskiella sp. JEL0078]|nr:hypothetical protein HK096_000180 [Nowakowskiella sp. JEL0078]